MKESFLHLVWQQKLFNTKELHTTEHKKIEIENFGVLNNLSGPDINSAIIKIDDQKWAGNIEIHVNSSDWYAHQHQKDKNYNNVILHVVYKHDVEVYDVHGNEIPVLVLKNYVSEKVLGEYNLLLSNKKKWIFCETTLKHTDVFKLKHWFERLMLERLERKTAEVEKWCKALNNDWEAVLFLMMAKQFGGNLNGNVLLDTFSKIEYATIRKQFVNRTSSAFLFGMVGLLKEDIEDAYYRKLQMEFQFQKQKYQLENLILEKLNFYGCRPYNFPTIRLAQLVAVYENSQSVFSKILELKGEVKLYKNIFNVSVHPYWKTHYNFGKESKKTTKKISDSFTELIIINVIVPVLFVYCKTTGLDTSFLLDIMYQLQPEKNNIIDKFAKIGCKASSALESQALLTLKKQYCDKERCAECEIGVGLINR